MSFYFVRELTSCIPGRTRIQSVNNHRTSCLLCFNVCFLRFCFARTHSSIMTVTFCFRIWHSSPPPPLMEPPSFQMVRSLLLFRRKKLPGLRQDQCHGPSLRCPFTQRQHCPPHEFTATLSHVGLVSRPLPPLTDDNHCSYKYLSNAETDRGHKNSSFCCISRHAPGSCEWPI